MMRIVNAEIKPHSHFPDSIECMVTMSDESGAIYYFSMSAPKDCPHRTIVAKCVLHILNGTIDKIVDVYFKEANLC